VALTFPLFALDREQRLTERDPEIVELGEGVAVEQRRPDVVRMGEDVDVLAQQPHPKGVARRIDRPTDEAERVRDKSGHVSEYRPRGRRRRWVHTSHLPYRYGAGLKEVRLRFGVEHAPETCRVRTPCSYTPPCRSAVTGAAGVSETGGFANYAARVE